MLVLSFPSIIMLLLYITDLLHAFPSYLSKPNIHLNDFIKHYELAYYNSVEVTSQHSRIKRNLQNLDDDNILKLTIATANRVFKLLLKPDLSLFADGVKFERGDGENIDFDLGKAYVGTLEDDKRSHVRGIVTRDGLFDGTISTPSEVFYIEPVSRYQRPSDGMPHTIVYRVSDTVQPSRAECASSILHAKTSRRKRQSHWLLESNQHRTSRSKPSGRRRLRSGRESRKRKLHETDRGSNAERPARERTKSRSAIAESLRRYFSYDNPPPPSVDNPDNVFYDFDFVNFSTDKKNAVRKKQLEIDYDSMDDLTRKLMNGTKRVDRKGWMPKEGFIDTVYKYTNGTRAAQGYGQKSNKILVASGPEDNDDHDARKRTAVDPKKTTCMLYLQADHLFFKKYETEEACIEVMTRHVQRVNSIYRNTDFNQDGKPDNISFMIKRVKVHSTANDSSYRFLGNYGVEKFLEIFSEEDYDAFCLAYMFTYRDFEMGTLGLAWTGDLKNAGGVCEKNGHYRGSLKSLNTGIVTVLNYGKHVPSAVSHVTLAHEIGHNFGSPHDPDGCTPGGEDGNFIMFARATSGDKKNNNKFSPCSLNAINPVLNVKARSSKGCFSEPQTSICGNGVVEPGEECDCGWEEDCKDTCCYPQRRYPPLDEQPCRLTPNAVCSPSQGPCCTSECSLKLGDVCRKDNGCRDSSNCNGISPQCPPSINKPNKTVCNEEYVCYMGECTGSICLAYGLESCQCIPTPTDAATKACELCCKHPGENQPCLSSFLWNMAPYDVPDMFAKPGTPCNNYNGYCDVFKKCREVDPSGPIATLRKLLLSEENLASFKKWAYDHWYYCGVIIFSILLLMFVSTKLFGKKPKIKSITLVHSTPAETVRLPTDGCTGTAVVVHPVVIRSKLPLKKKVREHKNRSNLLRQLEEPIPRNVNNNDNSPVEKKKSKQTKNKTNNLLKTSTTEEDALGKVRNWLISSHNMEELGSLKKAASSPAMLEPVEPKPTPKIVVNPVHGVLRNEKKKKKEHPPVKLQVVYKPPFKFSVKVGKHKNEISSHLIKDKRPEAVKQRAALLVRADRIRGNATSKVAPSAKPSSGEKAAPERRKAVPALRPTARVDYKRSVSAPQPSEPLYANAGVDSHYANVFVRRRNSEDTQRATETPKKRRNSDVPDAYRTYSVRHPKVVRRQISDETSKAAQPRRRRESYESRAEARSHEPKPRVKRSASNNVKNGRASDRCKRYSLQHDATHFSAHEKPQVPPNDEEPYAIPSDLEVLLSEPEHVFE